VNEGDGRTRISIFLNIFDVHVNRSPVSGVITDYVYQKGKFLVASLEEASSDNEQTIIAVRCKDGSQVVFKQIAGLIARRIIFTKKPGEFVQAGERIGLIKFGSRMDVILGAEWSVEVAPGSRVSAGSSILARRGGEVELTLAMQAGIKEPALCQT
jgi:phosphatidylserine decarboxylase